MLVISRCLTSAIRIGENVTVKVLKIGSKRVTLGVEAPPDVRVQREEVSLEESSASPVASSDLRVLVVEDTPVHAMLIERALQKRGISNVVRTSCGEDALKILSLAAADPAMRPDLVLLDLQLPGVSGYHVLESIKSMADLRSIPVVVLSGSDSDTDVSRCMAAGANAFVPKSESYDGFRQSVFRITEFWSQVRQASSPARQSA